ADSDITTVINEYQQSFGGQKTAHVDLENWEQREGVKDYGHFTSVTLWSEKGYETNQLQFMEPFTIKMGVRYLKAMPAPEVGVTILNSMGKRISRTASPWAGLRGEMQPGDYVYQVEFSDIGLPPGTYTLILW